MTVDLAPAGLTTAAGVDPWSLAEQVGSGDPAALQAGALRVRRAGLLAGEAASAGDRADRQLADGFRNDAAEVFDAAASTARGAMLLADRGEKIEEASRSVLEVAAALTETAASVASTVAGLDADLQRVSALVGAAAADQQRALGLAVDLVRAAGAQIQADLDAYNAVLVNRTARLEGLGYGGAPGGPGSPLSASFGLAPVFDQAGHLAGALGAAVRTNPEAVLGFLVGLGAVAAGSSLLAGGVVVTGGTGGAGVVVGGPAATGGYALLGVGATLLAAATERIAQAAGDELAVPPAAADPQAAAEPTPESRRAGVRQSVLNSEGGRPGEPGSSSKVRVVEEQQAAKIEQELRERLGAPDRVVEKADKGRAEIWDISPTETVVIRDFSLSGSRGTAGGRTIDIDVQGLEGVHKIHVKP